MQRADSFEKTLMLGNAGGEGDDRGWDGWMVSPTRWTWVWVHSRSWWWTGRPGVLQSMGSQRVEHNWATELNWMYTPREKSDAYNLIQRYLFTEIITTAWHYLFHILSSIELWHFLQVLFQYLKEVNTLHLHHILSMSHTGTLTLPLKNLIANLCVYSKSNLTNWTNKI